VLRSSTGEQAGRRERRRAAGVSATVGISAGLSIDHLVHAPHGARFDCLGGPGLYAALAARLVRDARVRLHAVLPRSRPEFGKVLTAAGVDCSYCDEADDVSRVWILNSAQGRRLVLTTPPLGVEFGGVAEHDPGELPPPPKGFLDELDGALYSSPSTAPRPGPAVVAVDPDQRHVSERGADYWRSIVVAGGVLLPSRVQLAAFGPDAQRAARTLATQLGVNVIARLDTYGMLAVESDGRAWHVSDEQVSVVETTGAGDASAGAIVAALATGTDLATAAAFGVSAARIVLSAWGHSALVEANPLTDPLPGIHIRRRA
jgi:pfkB family carbohydrate kinase